MTSLDFLYIALGGGFVLLVIFLSVLIIHLVLVLRDVTKISNNMREASDRIRDVVVEPMKALAEVSSGFGVVHDLIEKIKVRQQEAMEESSAQAKKSSAKSSSKSFAVKKLKK